MPADRIEATIGVTQAHIAEGIRKDCKRCPIALAMIDGIPGAEKASVTAGTLVFWTIEGNPWACNATPADARSFMRSFDSGAPVEPISFPATFRRVW